MQFVYNGFMNLKKIRSEAMEEHIPVISDEGLEFLLSILREHTFIQNILEIGTAVGTSSIAMAQVRWDMKIDTIEREEERYLQAAENIKEAGLEERIRVYNMDAMDFTPDTVYDLIFVDAAKSQYRRYMEHFLPYTRKGSYFFFDNLNFHGIVDDPERTGNRNTRQMVAKIRHFRDHLAEDKRLETVFYNEKGDGIAVSRVIID